MSFHDYQESRRISSGDTPFYALIMAAMRQADTANLALLREAFPGTWAELEARHDAPGGALPQLHHRLLQEVVKPFRITNGSDKIGIDFLHLKKCRELLLLILALV